jgi:hypothetical protein
MGDGGAASPSHNGAGMVPLGVPITGLSMLPAHSRAVLPPANAPARESNATRSATSPKESAATAMTTAMRMVKYDTKLAGEARDDANFDQSSHQLLPLWKLGGVYQDAALGDARCV